LTGFVVGAVVALAIKITTAPDPNELPPIPTFCDVSMVKAVVAPFVCNTKFPVVSPVDTNADPLVVPAEIELIFNPYATT
jgi:hypothetical protein